LKVKKNFKSYIAGCDKLHL